MLLRIFNSIVFAHTASSQTSVSVSYTHLYTIVRLNGAISAIFKDWLDKTFPDRAEKVWHQISECHGGNVNDSRFGTRMSGEGKIAESIKQLFKVSKDKFMKGQPAVKLDSSLFNYKAGETQLSLF